MERDDALRFAPGWSLAPLADFGQAVDAVLEHLATSLPLRTWLLVRVDGDDALVLAAAGDGATAAQGSRFPWAGSVSAAMARDGLWFTAKAAGVPCCRDTPAVREGRVGAYLGIPICRGDGTLFGVLAGVSPDPVPVDLAAHLPVVELLGRLLAGVLAVGLRTAVDDREDDRHQMEELHDPVTGLGDRRYWDRVLAAEESRCRRYGDPAAVVVLHLDEYAPITEEYGDGATQVLLRRAARVLRTQCREEDLVARVAPGTFAVLSVGADADGAAALVERLRVHLEENAVAATLHFKARDPRHGLIEAFATVDHPDRVEQRQPA